MRIATWQWYSQAQISYGKTNNPTGQTGEQGTATSQENPAKPHCRCVASMAMCVERVRTGPGATAGTSHCLQLCSHFWAQQNPKCIWSPNSLSSTWKSQHISGKSVTDLWTICLPWSNFVTKYSIFAFLLKPLMCVPAPLPPPPPPVHSHPTNQGLFLRM